jgi:hypothetical protein
LKKKIKLEVEKKNERRKDIQNYDNNNNKAEEIIVKKKEKRKEKSDRVKERTN